ncbi:NAD(P)-dependent oxidoreductase [Pelagibius sp. CAU 1746]|uniref:NAD-dependent epimerase/dehydratase family protein n=1 Tax=Pelagibius sp. CAU 1746 TaxID=3140370 RepID=UPI00325C2419
MKVLVTGSAGYLGEALVRSLRQRGDQVEGLDILASPCTTRQGSLTDRAFVRRCLRDVATVYHAATLHKPHVATHSRQDFIDTNITGTLNLLEEAVEAGVGAFVFTSTTSVFGDALVPPPGEPAAWITEEVAPVPKNIYGVTKTAAENLCQLFHRRFGLPVVVLRTSRFFPEPDDSPAMRDGYADANVKANEFLARRVDIEDAVTVHLLAAERAAALGFGRYIVSATTPFGPDDLPELRRDAAAVVRRLVPAYENLYAAHGWRMFPSLDRVYVNAKARDELGWRPTYDFAQVVADLAAGRPLGSALAREIGSKSYHAEVFAEGPYPVE